MQERLIAKRAASCRRRGGLPLGTTSSASATDTRAAYRTLAQDLSVIRPCWDGQYSAGADARSPLRSLAAPGRQAIGAILAVRAAGEGAAQGGSRRTGSAARATLNAPLKPPPLHHRLRPHRNPPPAPAGVSVIPQRLLSEFNADDYNAAAAVGDRPAAPRSLGRACAAEPPPRRGAARRGRSPVAPELALRRSPLDPAIGDGRSNLWHWRDQPWSSPARRAR